MPVEFRAATIDDAYWFARRLRQSDIDELTAASGPDILDQLIDAVRRSGRMALVASARGEPFALFGFAPAGLVSTRAAPWLVGTPAAAKQGRALIRFGRAYCAAAAREYPVLVNYVDVRNTSSIRWLERIGFKMEAPAPFGVAGLPFMRFSNVR